MPAGQKQKPRDPLSHVPLVGIGASAGGLEAVTELLKHLPVGTGLGFVLVQHLDPQHESALTQILARATSMPVREITDNLPVEANQVYIIPPNANLTVAKGVLKLRPRQQARTPPRSIDFFFESLAQDQGERTMGVILSGTATDGTLGLEAIKAAGGITFAQDASARYDSMPRSAIASGCVDFVLKPEDIAKELARIAKHPYIASPPHEPISLAEDGPAATEHAHDKTALTTGGPGSLRSGAKQARAEAKAASGQDVTDRQRAEAATALLAAIVNSSDDAIIGKDLAGVITSWNKSAERLFGYTAREAIGQPIKMLSPPDRQQEQSEILERLKRGETVNHFETVRVTKNGSRLEISLTISPIKDAKGQIIGASKIVRDITKRKRAEEALHVSEERYRTLFDFDPVAIYSCDTSGVIQQFNRRAAELWGREPASGDTDERFCGSFKLFRPDGSFMPHEQCPMAEVVAGKIPAAHDAEVVIERPDGSRITVVVNIRPLKTAQGEITGAINCFYDITQRKQAEEALAQSHAQLQLHAEELIRFNRAAVGRELRMIELKKEINELCQRHGEAARYPLEFEEQEGKESDG